jgi:molybdate transport system substrate-binding protein
MRITPQGAWSRVLAIVLAASVGLASAAAADEIKVITSGAFTPAFKDLAPAFERATTHTIVTTYGASLGNAPDSIPSRLGRGEPVDLVILAREGLDALVQQGKIVPGSERDVVRSSMAMAIRAGAPRPDVSSVDAFTRTLLAAKSIAYSTSASGVYLANQIFPRLGIADALRPKTRRVESGPVGIFVASGEAEIGFQQYSELLVVPGLDIITALPPEVQRVYFFSAGIVAGAKAPDAARALVAFLTSAAAAPAIRQSGLEPLTSRQER